MKRATLDGFFIPTSKKSRRDESGPQVGGIEQSQSVEHPSQSTFALSSPVITGGSSCVSRHATYPHPILDFPESITSSLSSMPSTVGKTINDEPDLDLLLFQPYIPSYLEREVFLFLRRELPFYRVEYDITRGAFSTHIRTPRYTTVFGLDETCRFDENGKVVATATRTPVVKDKHYDKYAPRPLPKCLDDLRKSTEEAAGCRFNFCLVNYYASGSDSISYHSDDERFLGPEPAIASFSFGACRDFLMKHKPYENKGPIPVTKHLKLPLRSGDMLLMRGRTQANWLHSIPKRSGKNADDGGRINITFRKALVRAGTENYYNYNVGVGPVHRWNENAQEMQQWTNK